MTTHAAGHTRPLAERLSTRTLKPKEASGARPTPQSQRLRTRRTGGRP